MLCSRKKYLVLGSTGLVGSAFLNRYRKSIITAGRSSCDLTIDLTDKNQIKKIIKGTPANVVVNFAAYTNVDETEKQKNNLKSPAYILNAKVPEWLSGACRKYRKHFIHISTDYVFDGNQDNRPYLETDAAAPVDSWYCQTKRLGETKIEKVFGNKNHWTIVRISFPYTEIFKRKLDIARTVIDRLKKGLTYSGVVDEKIKPTHVNEIASAVNLIAKKQAYGIYHVAGDWPGGFITPYDFAVKIAVENHLDPSLIKKVAFEQFIKTRISLRPKHTWLDTTKIKQLKNLC